MDPDECSASALREELKLQNPPILLDVRRKADFEQWKIDSDGLQIFNLPYDELMADGWCHPVLESIGKDQPIRVICYRGNSSHSVTTHLNRLGFSAKSVHGGMRAWGELYETHQIHSSKSLEIYQIARMGRGCLSYVVISDGRAFVIDPTRHLQPYVDLIKEKQATVSLVIDTHAHADHITGGRGLSEIFGAPYLLHPYDAIHPIDLMPATFHVAPLWEGQHLHLGKVDFEVLHLPGHTLGHVGLLLENQFLLGGDTLLIDSIGRPDLGGKGEGWLQLLHHSLQRLQGLPDQVLLLPGHCKKASVCKTFGEIKKNNADFMLAKGPFETFKGKILSNLPIFPEGYIEIKRINLGQVEPTEDQISKLEAGKNLCSVS